MVTLLTSIGYSGMGGGGGGTTYISTAIYHELYHDVCSFKLCVGCHGVEVVNNSLQAFVLRVTSSRTSVPLWCLQSWVPSSQHASWEEGFLLLAV